MTVSIRKTATGFEYDDKQYQGNRRESEKQFRTATGLKGKKIKFIPVGVFDYKGATLEQLTLF